MAAPDVSDLFIRYCAGETSEAETAYLMEQIASGNDPELAGQLLSIEWDRIRHADPRFTPEKGLPVLQQILDVQTHEKSAPVRISARRMINRMRYAAAILILVGALVYMWTARNTNSSPVYSKAQLRDVMPGKEGAILTLADGSQILLDTMKNGIVANEAGTRIAFQNGRLVYQPQASAEVAYNTMTTPRGRQFQVILPDGSKVWLNAASSLKYPTVFAGSRRVEITGEAYFEIVKNKTSPFFVKTGVTEVEVLGTSFNVNAYDDEPDMKTTLVEGSVQVKGNNAVVLSPGQQAITAMWRPDDKTPPDAQITVRKANVNQVIAWKSGAFDFQDKTVPEIMRQLARWYNIDIVYKGVPPPIEFFGKIGRDLQLSQVISFLQHAGVNCRMTEGSRLEVFSE